MIAGVPSDNTTLLDVLAEFAEKGFGASAWVTETGKVRCDGCEAEFEPTDLRVHELRRLEGASDPDDMIAVVAVECSSCEMKGSLVLHFGPEASAEEMDVLTHLQKMLPPA